MIKIGISGGFTTAQECIDAVQELLINNGFGALNDISVADTLITMTMKNLIFGKIGSFKVTFTPGVSKNVAIVYDTETKFFMLCMSSFRPTDLMEDNIISCMTWQEDSEAVTVIGDRDNAFGAHYNVMTTDRYGVLSDNLSLVPAFRDLKRIPGVYFSLDNALNSGVIVTDGTNRFLCAGGFIFIKLEE